MRIYLEGGPFDGKAVELDAPSVPGRITVIRTGALRGWVISSEHRERVDPSGTLDEQLGPEVEGHEFTYALAGRTLDDGTPILEFEDKYPRPNLPESSANQPEG
jgi:hypothetical protein